MHEGNITIFCRKVLCLTVPKNFVGEQFCVLQNFRYPKNLWIRGEGEVGREYHDFLSKRFLFHSAEKLRRGKL